MKQIIKNTDYYNIREGHNFYVVDKFFETNFYKKSPGPLRGKMYLRLAEYTSGKKGLTAENVAQLINENSWE